jgi:hypothetical protein
MKSYEELIAAVRQLQAERWAHPLSAEPAGRPAGRRPRDPEKEALLAELDRMRLAKSELVRDARREPVEPAE